MTVSSFGKGARKGRSQRGEELLEGDPIHL